jgi:hypothetical protein
MLIYFLSHTTKLTNQSTSQKEKKKKTNAELCRLLGYYAEQAGLEQTFQDYLSSWAA